MSGQKKTQTDRKVELPNWTKEVKPSEDVMALFYAPTGLPQAGALSPVFSPINPNKALQTEVSPINSQEPTSNEDIFSNQVQEVKIKETPTKSKQLEDRDQILDLDHKLDQKDHKLDQKKLQNMPYRNSTPYQGDTVSISDRVSDIDTVSNDDTLSNKALATKLFPYKGFIAIPIHLLDDLAKTLTPTEWTLYLRLFRLSYGWHKDTCIVGLEALVEATNIGRTVLRETLKSLQNRKLIQVVETINTKDLKGTKYRIYTLSENNTLSKSDRVSKNNTVSATDTASNFDTIKYIDDDHDDYIKKDHHQNKSQASLTEHEKSVMMIVRHERKRRFKCKKESNESDDVLEMEEGEEGNSKDEL